MSAINQKKLLARLHQLGNQARDEAGILSRVALTDNDRGGRDLLRQWMLDAGLSVSIDAIGNLFATWHPELPASPLMMGSHIDSVVNAGIYDGCYGVLSGLAVIESLMEEGIEPDRPVMLAAFTNEEGSRYAPDMMGSLVYAGGLALETALETIGKDGSRLGDELERIGYIGDMQPGSIIPCGYLELHIEQGPVLEAESITIGVVENLQGISWQEITINGVANHAGTTPTGMRRDAGLAAARINCFVRDELAAGNPHTVATVGCLRHFPDVINVIPSRAVMSVDLRDPDEARLRAAESALENFIQKLAVESDVEISSEPLARFEPVQFDEPLASCIEQSAAKLGYSSRRMTSGAGHDAQMMARICPSAMIFVPSVAGISHNPKEFTHDEDLFAGADVLLETVRSWLSESR